MALRLQEKETEVTQPTLKYPVIYTPDFHNTPRVRFTDIPEAGDFGIGPNEAERSAEDILITAINFYFDNDWPIPLPSTPEENQETVDVGEELSEKIRQWNAEFRQARVYLKD